MDHISSDSGIFRDSKLYHSYFRYNISFIDPPLGGFGEIFPSVMIYFFSDDIFFDDIFFFFGKNHHFRKYFAESPSLRVYK